MMKYALACALSLIGLVIVAAAIMPALANLAAGLGVDVPARLSRTTGARIAHSYPAVLLIIGLALLAPVIYALWRIFAQ